VVIIVAERISTVAGAGQILVLDDGRLVAEGTHSELLETSSTYREIAESQFASGNMS
jgi:ATP-binding cassette subfamily B protein